MHGLNNISVINIHHAPYQPYVMPIALLSYNNNSSTPRRNKDFNTMDAGTSPCFVVKVSSRKHAKAVGKEVMFEILDEERFSTTEDIEVYTTATIIINHIGIWHHRIEKVMSRLA